MTTCVWCQRAFPVPLTLPEILAWRPLPQPSLCPSCQDRLTPITGNRCPDCGRQQATRTVCHDCERWQAAPLKNHALFRYDAGMKAYMQQYKFQGDYALRKALQAPLSRALSRQTYDILVPIPIDQQTWRTRGFNQVTGWLRDQPYYQALVVKNDHKERPQSAKTRAERLLTPQPFQLVEQVAPVLIGQRVLLLDDVYTTGRTLRHAADQIYLGGAKTVTSLTLAR